MPPDQPTPAFHHLPAERCVSLLNARPEGLGATEAAQRLRTLGPNLLPAPAPPGLLRRFLAQLRSVLVQVLIAAAAITAAMGHWVDTGVILAVVVANALIGLTQEVRAEAAVAAIRGMLAPRATVLRDGRRIGIAAAALVVGDIVLLETGDQVPADLRILEATGLAAQEAILSGESLPVAKDVAEVAPGAPLGERASMLWSGTMIVQGRARGLVVATGPATEIGRIGALVGQVERPTTPLVAQMDRFARWLSALILAMAGLLLIHGHFFAHRDFPELFMAVVAVAVAAIPEVLPAAMTITPAVGAQEMARRNAILRNLPAIETIGAVSVICTDKTGTLTRNEMFVSRVETPAGIFDVTGEGYAPEGMIRPAADLSAIARAAARCNDAALLRASDGWSVEGDPMEGALLAFAAKAGAATEARRRDAIPFESTHRFMAVLSDAAGEGWLDAKGAPERILRMCEGIDQHHWHARAEAMARGGLRVLALASRRWDGPRIERAALEGGMTFLGLLGLIDPPRPEAIRAVAACRAAGIGVKMITGDHAGTASAIAAQMGIEHPSRVLTGAEMDGIDDIRLAALAARVDVFARTSPEHKLRLVAALQGQGKSVAMTGDGVNDAPALRRADVGIAMGRKGSAAAREAADIVLADDNFASIAAAVRIGRMVRDNLEKVISWTLPTNAGESATVVLALLLGLGMPVTPVQILWINLVTGITLAIALAFEPPEPGSMLRPPRPRDAPLLSGALVWHVVFVSALFVVAVFGVFAYAAERGHSLALAQTMAMNTLVVLEIFHLIFIRNIYGTSLRWRVIRGTKVVWGGVAAILLAQIAVTYLPLAQRMLGTAPVPFGDAVLIGAVGAVFFVVIEIEKQLRLSLR